MTVATLPLSSTGMMGRMLDSLDGIPPMELIAPMSAHEPSMFLTLDFCQPLLTMTLWTLGSVQLGSRKLAEAGLTEMKNAVSISSHRLLAAAGKAWFAVFVEITAPGSGCAPPTPCTLGRPFMIET